MPNIAHHSQKLYMNNAVSINFFALTVVSGLLNYLYYPLLAKILPVAEFGASQVLITILMQASSAFAGISLLAIYLIKRTGNKQASTIIITIQKFVVAFILLLTLTLLSFRSSVATFLNFNDNLNILYVSLTLIMSIPFVIAYGFLIASKNFIKAGILQLITVIFKLIFGVALAVSFGSSGAILGIALCYAGGLVFYNLICKLRHTQAWGHDIKSSYELPSRYDLSLTRLHMANSILILFVGTVVSIIPTLDIIIARHRLDSYNAGIYSASSTLSSLLLFAVLPLISMLLPTLDLSKPIFTRRAIRKIILLILGLSFVTTLIFYLVPSALLGVFGSEYTIHSSILWIFALNMSALSLLILTVQVIALYRPAVSAIISIITMIVVLTLLISLGWTGVSIISLSAAAYAIILLATLFFGLLRYLTMKRFL